MPGGQASSCQVWPIIQIRDRFKNPDPGFLGHERTTINDAGDRLIGDTAASGYIVESCILRLSPDVLGEPVSLSPSPRTISAGSSLRSSAHLLKAATTERIKTIRES